jgi:hypothetical protein
MRIEKTEVDKILVDKMDKINEKESSIIISELKEEWMKENVDSILKDDNYYFVDFGDWSGKKRVLTKVESFRVLIDFLKNLSFLDSMDYSSLDESQYVTDTIKKLDINVDFLDEIQNYLITGPKLYE